MLNRQRLIGLKVDDKVNETRKHNDHQDPANPKVGLKGLLGNERVLPTLTTQAYNDYRNSSEEGKSLT
jgi:hypothetical protein